MSSTFEEAVKKTDAEDHGQPKSTKATFLRGSEDPDVTIIVGGQVFKEYRQSLRCWSGYFDRGLSSGMKEEESLQFEFPGRDPKEWEWIIAVMSPMPKVKVTMEKLSIALDWFDFLCSNLGLEECDGLLRAQLKLNENAQMHLELVMRSLEMVVKYNLKNSKAKCFKTVRTALVKDATLFSKDWLATITGLVKDNVECRSQFLGPLKNHLPASISEEQAEVMIGADILHEMIQLKVDLVKIKKRQQAQQEELEEHYGATERMVNIVGRTPPPLYNCSDREIKNKMKNDEFWGKVVPDNWAD